MNAAIFSSPTTTTRCRNSSSRRVRRGIAPIALGLCVSVVAPLALGPAMASADTASPTSTEAAVASAANNWDLLGKLVVEDGLTLRQLEVVPGRYTSTRQALPATMTPGTALFEYDSSPFRNTEVVFTYAIDDTYVLWARILKPAVGGNQIHAEIRQRGQTHGDANSPYKVDYAWQWGGEIPNYDAWDPRPWVRVSKKSVVTVTDRLEQGRLLDRLCADGGDQCSYVPRTFTENSEGKVVNKVNHRNDGALDSRHDYRVTHTTTVTNRSYTELKTKMMFEVLVAKAEFGIKRAYDHSVSRTETIDERITMNVPAGRDGRIDVIEMWQKVNGDIVLQEAGVTYALVDVDFDFPAVPVWVVTTTPF